MTVRFGEGGGFKGLFGQVQAQLGGRAARLGDIVQVGRDETLLAPPRGRLWHSPKWAQGLFQLNDLVHHPVFEVGDVFGIHPDDPVPLAPSGTKLARVYNPEAVEDGAVAAKMFKVVRPPAAQMAIQLPKPTPPLESVALHEQPREPGKRWQVVGVDGRNLKNLIGTLVPAAIAA